MSREIKIRIRSKATGKLVCCYQQGIRMTPDTGQLYVGDLNVTHKYWKEEYTGRKDSKGVEIYEGDAEVKSEPIDNVYGESAGWLEFRRVVAWSDNDACFVVHESSEDKNMEREIYPISEFVNDDGKITGFLVTHNIHENPELTKDDGGEVYETK